MVLEIVKYGDPVLRAKGKRIEQVDDAIKQLAADMTETMYHAHGLGLAAQQVGVALQITVVDVAPVQQERPEHDARRRQAGGPGRMDAAGAAQPAPGTRGRPRSWATRAA